MNDLTLSKKFALISLNGVQVTKTPEIGRLRERCLTVSQLLNFILTEKMVEVNNQYCFIYDAPSSFKDNEKFLYDLIKEKSISCHTLLDWVNLLDAIPQEQSSQWADRFINEMKEGGLLDNILPLMECGFYHHISGERQLRSSYNGYHEVMNQIKDGILEQGVPSDEWICLLWLLNQSGDLPYILTAKETGKVQETLNKSREKSRLSHNLSRIFIKEEKVHEKKSFLSKKSEPVKKESIFIPTEKMFADARERIVDVKKVLESNGHIFEVKSEGDVSLAEIDNVLYELIPDAVKGRVLNVHGVRLRRHLN